MSVSQYYFDKNQEKRIHLADEEDKGDIKKCHLLDVCISEAVSPVSLVSTASGCPINLVCIN